MFRNMTIGQYYPADSLIHKLDPRVKLACTLLFIISLFLFSSFAGYVVAAIYLGTVVTLSKVPIKYILRGLKGIVILLLFTVFLNLVLTPGTVVVELPGPFQITIEGIRTASFMAIRLMFLIIGSSLMTFTTTPNELTDGMEKGLSPLKKIGVPVHEIAMMMSIALRFIPILIEETDKIMKAQAARGADFESGNFMKRAKAMIPILVPLFVSAFRRANDLALAMEARCYNGGEGRTTMKPLKYNSRDIRAYIITFIYMALLIIVNKIAKRYLPF